MASPSNNLSSLIPSKQVADALRSLGKGDGTDADAAKARLFLETLPLPVLLEAVAPLWTKEEGKRHKRVALWRSMAGAVVAIFLASIVLLFMGKDEPNGQQGYRFRSQIVQILAFVVSAATQFTGIELSSVSPLQCGVVRICRLRLKWQLVPVLIEALPIDFKVATASKMDVNEHRLASRALLTQLLPLWCREDTAALTPKQRRILLKELKEVAFAGAHKNTFYTTGGVSLSAADADFCLAILDVLRYLPENGSSLDKNISTTLSRLPAPIHAEDVNRRYVQEAAHAVLNQSHL